MAPRPESPAAGAGPRALGAAMEHTSVDDRDLILQHVFVMFRHGDRSPISRRVSAKVAMTQRETDFWVSRLAELSVVGALNSGTRVVSHHAGDCGEPCGGPQFDVPPPQQGGRWPCGQLTAKGIAMMRDRGQQLRERYKLLLEDADPVHHVHVQSTNIRRTIRSAQSVLAGLFPEHFVNVDAGSQMGANESLLPDSRRFLSHVQSDRRSKKDEVLIIHADDSNSLAPQHSYELYRDLGKMLADELRQHAPPGFAEASQRISTIIGAGSSKLVAWTGLREVLVCRQAHGLAFPDGLDQQLFAQICEYDAWLWHHLYGNLDFCRASFRAGVQRIYSYLTGVVEGQTQHKLLLFSAHDNSLVALVNALQLQVPRVIPPYGAMLTFELFRHRVTGEVYLRALFEGAEVAFAGHEHAALCPFAVFQQSVQSFLHGSAL
ncbi:putative histidine acid phosphatase [Phytophthora cinnamomi]|uniref:putative histidine acid phosphatase n=1 Tax=Phytophthora cinnamomi TaxID=4785 RepID=UPI00355A940B|nr:putative histidine acid phosphatase [Phytophthora cinnamomi]